MSHTQELEGFQNIYFLHILFLYQVLLRFCGFFKTLSLLNITPHLFLYIYIFVLILKFIDYWSCSYKTWCMKTWFYFENFTGNRTYDPAGAIFIVKEAVACHVSEEDQSERGSGSISSPWSAFLYLFYWLQDKFWDMRISLQHIKAYQKFYLKLIRLTMETLSSSWILLEYFVIRHPPLSQHFPSLL